MSIKISSQQLSGHSGMRGSFSQREMVLEDLPRDVWNHQPQKRRLQEPTARDLQAAQSDIFLPNELDKLKSIFTMLSEKVDSNI